MSSHRRGPGFELTLASAAVLCLWTAGPARAGDFSFTGTFAGDDDFQLFKISVAAGATITVRSWSYAGGVNAAGQTIAPGGFDPILGVALSFNGLVFIQRDDGPEGTVPADAATGQAWDVLLKASQSELGPGDYTIILTQFDDYAKSFYLANRFEHSGNPTFTAAFPGPACPRGQFKDASASNAAKKARPAGSGSATAQCRDGHWALDILNVVSAQAVSSVPTLLSATGLTATAGVTTASKQQLTAKRPVPLCESGGPNAITVDSQGKMLAEPDCLRPPGLDTSMPKDASEPPPPAIGLTEIPVTRSTP